MGILSKIKTKLGARLIQEIRQLNFQVCDQQLPQRQLFIQYQQLVKQGLELPCFRDAAFRVYSQADEDGILLYIFALIGFTNKLLVDMAFRNPYGANTTNLICNWGFNPLSA